MDSTLVARTNVPILLHYSIWTAKYAICEFLRRMTTTAWQKLYQTSMRFVQIFLATTFVAVFLATLTECQPITHYWQVVPDPGPHCRLGYANLLTMGVCDILTDLLLVAFPIPFVLLSKLPLSRKIGLVLLFSLSLALVAITAYRVPSVISRDGLQTYRSLVASLEILAATAISNFIVIGSFVRDRGAKKTKFKREVRSYSISESVEGRSLQRQVTVTTHRKGSDVDLANELGYRLDPNLQYPESKLPRPAPVALASREFAAMTGGVDPKPSANRHSVGTESDLTSRSDSLIGVKVHPHEYIHQHPSGRVSPSPSTRNSPRKVSFFDVGHLLDASPPRPAQAIPSSVPLSPPTVSASSPLLSQQRSPAFFHDIGGLFSRSLTSPNSPREHRPPATNFNPETRETGLLSRFHRGANPGTSSPKLNDAGGLLDAENEKK